MYERCGQVPGTAAVFSSTCWVANPRHVQVPQMARAADGRVALRAA